MKNGIQPPSFAAMTVALNEQLNEVVRLKRIGADVALGDALREGMTLLYRDAVTEACLRGQLSRDDAISRIGEAAVLRAEQEMEIVREDIEWGLHGNE
ncbi:MAG: hypothetical protein LBK99_14730 [Opitutaceae bacterium]|nr:hypothetical protein [Opitutaceae bacterium]